MDTQMPYPHTEQPDPVLFHYGRDGQPLRDQEDVPQTVALPLVAYTVRQDAAGTWVAVSTVFLGLDASLGFADQPLLWETLVWGGAQHGRIERYGAEEYAVLGHQRVVEEVWGAWDAVPQAPMEQGLADAEALQ